METNSVATARAEGHPARRARANALQRARSPRWVAGATAVAAGLLVGLAVSGVAWWWLLGAGLLLVGCACMEVVVRRRRGVRPLQVTDDRAVGAQMGAYAVGLLPLWLVAMLRPGELVEPSLRPWVAVGCAVVVGLGAYGYQRWVEAYQYRRQASGDYGPWDRT